MSLEAVIGAFASQVAELRETTLLRVDDNAKDLYSQELKAIESTVRALEVKFKDIKQYVKSERDAIPRAESIIEAAKLQRKHLDHIRAHLPTYLPSLTSPAPTMQPVLQEKRTNATKHTPSTNDPKKKSTQQPLKATRRYITNDEFQSVSTYMRQRLSADKVNAALDEIASHAETNASLVSAIKSKRPVGADKKHAQWLTFNIANQEGLKGRMWVLESDLKSGAALRLDKTGKTVLTLLRHLGRLTELRIAVEGTTHIVYSLI